MEINKIYQGNSLEILKTFKENSIDAVVTDPPYGLSDHKESKIRETLQRWLNDDDDFVPDGKGFMGKEWDAFVPPPALWKEIYRVMKPGAHILCFAGTRSVDLMSLSLRLAGFEIRDTLVWLYGSGFPKSLNIGKAVDKLLGNKRKIIGKNLNHGTLKETNCMIGEPHTGDGMLTRGNTQWEGWGTSLKPAIEPIILARKPLSEKNVAENVLKWGTSGLNIDVCKIGNEIIPAHKRGKAVNTNFMSGGFTPEHQGRFPSNFIIQCTCDEVIEGKERPPRIGRKGGHKGSFGSWAGSTADSIGRWPADKQIIHTNPNCPCYLLDQQSGLSKSRPDYRTNEIKKSTVYFANKRQPNLLNDEGGASRFFKQITFEPEDYLPFYYCSKASKSERNMGLEELPLKEAGGMQGRNDGSFDGKITYNQNHHPTVKPVRLCQYLVKLITPPNGIVLDPFAGSGSTLIACKKLGFNFIGIELNPEYVLIAEKRLQAIDPNLFNEVNNGA